jgi:CBS domain-containing protein
MRVYEILQTKGHMVHQIATSASLEDAVERLVQFNCGSLMVVDADLIVGIITERDILKAIDSQKQSLSCLSVRDFMTRKLVTGHPSDEVESVMGIMTSHRVRHLPIFDQGRLAGMISIGDVVKAQFDLLAVENHYLKVYIQG